MSENRGRATENPLPLSVLCHLSSVIWTGAPGGPRTCTGRVLKPPPLPIGLPARARGRPRTCTVRRLRPGLYRLGYTGDFRRAACRGPAAKRMHGAPFESASSEVGPSADRTAAPAAALGSPA